MGRAWTLIAFVLLFGVSGAVAAQAPTEAEVRAPLDRVDQAIPARDFDTIAASLGEDVRISGSLSTGSTVIDRFDYDKRTYLSAMRAAWDQASDYTYRRDNSRIAISGEVATVTADVFERATLVGGVVSTQTRETTTVERVDGALRVTRVVADATVSSEPR